MKIINASPTRAPILVALLTLIIASAMSYSSYLGRDFAVRYAPLIDAAMEIKLEATTAHLWFEEIISGDRVVQIEDIWKHIDQSRWYAQAMLDGGENEEGRFVPLQEPILRQSIKQTIKGIDDFQRFAHQRWEEQSQSGIGSDIDQRFDKAFKDFITSADTVETELQKAMKKQLQEYKIEQYLLILLIILIGILIGGILYRYDRQRIAHILILKNKEKMINEMSSVNVFDHSIYGEESLYDLKEKTKNTEEEQLKIQDYQNNSEHMEEFLDIAKKRYGIKKIDNYVKELLDDKSEINISDVAIQEKEDLILLMLAYFRAQDKLAKYKIEFYDETVKIGNYIIPDGKIILKEKL
mgnify:CR=1 FL=1